jgi:hypothetical protein
MDLRPYISSPDFFAKLGRGKQKNFAYGGRAQKYQQISTFPTNSDSKMSKLLSEGMLLPYSVGNDPGVGWKEPSQLVGSQFASSWK